MTSHFDSIYRVSLVLGVALLAMPLLKSQSAVARRLVLSVAFASVLVIPFLPAWHVDAPVYRALLARVVSEPSVAAIGEQAAPLAATGVARSIHWLVFAWAIGACFVAARFLVGLVVAQRLVGRATSDPTAWEAAIASAERVTGLRAVVRVSTAIEAPAVTGIVSPVVIVPVSAASWTDDRKRAVLLHELAHVAAHDLGVQVLATIACSLHWFNPLAWLVARRLRLERELAADEAVLRSGVRASTYAADLLAIAGAAPAGAIAIGEKPLPKRIAAIVAERRPVVLSPTGASALVVGTAALAFSVACATSAASTSPKLKASQVSARAVDRELQALADRELERMVTESKGAGGTILVMSPNGDVLADAGGHTDRLYVAGSTMKAVLLAAAIDEGVVTESDVFDCSNGVRSGQVMRDSTPLGKVALPELLAKSSNIGFSQIFDRLGAARLDRALHRFHFATAPEFATTPSADWNGTSFAIGATMSTTPRQVALAYAALANGGDGIVTSSTAKRVGALLEGVVAKEDGTGKNARVAGVRVAGKTGTSEWTAADGSRRSYASFVGYVPAERPRYVIFVGVEAGPDARVWGGGAAAPVFARIATRALTR